MLHNTINRISSEFLLEAESSPRLMEDMASMEKYMAESYGGRTFIELLQNADDASSKRVKLLGLGDFLLFANDGRPFDENDVVAISRSGASSKQRGTSIGYRGVGFKSTAYLTSEIMIYSNDTFFTFSKKKCSEVLDVDAEKVPTIRIPFVLEQGEIEAALKEEISNLVHDGYTTVFIFKDINIETITDELKDINNGFFLFLRNIEFAEFNLPSKKKRFTINRKGFDDKLFVSIDGEESENWLIISKDHIAPTGLAFKLDKSNKVIPCNENEAVFHCFLPTLEKTGYPFKINSDFSTDPSRKHLSMDEITDRAIKNAAIILFSIIENVINGDQNETFEKLFEILLKRSSFTKFAMLFNEELKRLITNKKWLRLSNGDTVKVDMYKIFPDWLEESEKRLLRNTSKYIKDQSLDTKKYENLAQIDVFIQEYTLNKFEVKDFIEVLMDENFVKDVNPLTSGKILGNTIKSTRTKTLISGENYDLSDCNILGDNSEVIKLRDLNVTDNAVINIEVKEIVNQVASSDLDWFCSEYKQNFEVWKANTPKATNILTFHSEVININKKVSISRWRSAEQQCVEIETGFGNNAKDVSKQNLGYDIESTTTDGEIRYIEVKSLSNIGDSFSMTNNEYTAAHQYGEKYYLCLIVQMGDSLKAIYIRDPLSTIAFEKRVRQWEWFCDEYTGEQYTLDLK